MRNYKYISSSSYFAVGISAGLMAYLRCATYPATGGMLLIKPLLLDEINVFDTTAAIFTFAITTTH